MKALNLYTLTRAKDSAVFSRLAQALSGRSWHKPVSAHEAASLCALVDALFVYFQEQDPGAEWFGFFDGFYFSYTIEHISKEFDLLKLSRDMSCVLNIELKSESIEEERIRRQLEQNRYYLSHISRTILSYTYVMETDTLYCLNDRGYMRSCGIGELAQAMQRPALVRYVEDNIQECFRARDYLISPVNEPEKFLTGRYFLTNQQSDFRRQILEILQEYESKRPGLLPVISLTGAAGTGKTLLMLDLAMEISRKHRVLFLHGGPLRDGHRLIDRRLHKVTILSGTDPASFSDPAGKTETVPAAVSAKAKGSAPDHFLERYYCILVDEANRFPSGTLLKLMEGARKLGTPCIFSFDPHSILGSIPAMEDTESTIRRNETHCLELSGNIRINRPVFSFLRTLFNRKDRSGHVDYSCIDVLYAADRKEEEALTGHYLSRGYKLISPTQDAFRPGDIISQEFDRVLMKLDRQFYYDGSMHLCADSTKGPAIPLLYEGLSRAREKLCLLVVGNEELFSQVLAIRLSEEE